MKTFLLLSVFCSALGVAPAQQSASVNPYTEESDYWAFRAYDALTHVDHMLRCKILYREVRHTSAAIYSVHEYYAEVLECPKGGMIGKGCVISYWKQMEDHQQEAEGRYAAAGEVYLGFDSNEVVFDAEKKIWQIRGNYSFRAMGANYDYGKAMRRVMQEHPELVDQKPEATPSVGEKLRPFIADLENRSRKEAPANTHLYIKRLLTLLPLIEQGKPVDMVLPETKGNTALHYACALGDAELVKCLLQLGANPKACTDKGITPMQCASGKDALIIQALLKEYGARR